MAKKTPKSNKNEQAEAKTKASKINKNARKKDLPKNEEELQLFSAVFYSKVDQFKDLYEEINANIAGSDGGKQFNVEEKYENVRTALESNCSEILKNHLSDAQKWLGEKIEQLKETMNSLQEHEKAAKEILEKSGALNQDQISQSLSALREKITQKEDSLAEYEKLLQQSKAVYD